MEDGIILRGILLVTYMFSLVVAYIILSNPFEQMIAGIETGAAGAGITEVASTGTILRLTFNICFALAGIIPSIWFIAWVFGREPDWSYRRY